MPFILSDEMRYDGEWHYGANAEDPRDFDEIADPAFADSRRRPHAEDLMRADEGVDRRHASRQERVHEERGDEEVSRHSNRDDHRC